jgi:hypothetical protein
MFYYNKCDDIPALICHDKIRLDREIPITTIINIVIMAVVIIIVIDVVVIVMQNTYV